MWERGVLWSVLVMSVLTITAYQWFVFSNHTAIEARIAQEEGVGRIGDAARTRGMLDEFRRDNVLRMNVSWICIVISVVGLALTRRPSVPPA